MAGARYEIRVVGRMSQRARCAFSEMEVKALPPQTSVVGEVDEQAGLRALLALCSSLGLEVVSIHRLPD